MARGMGIAVAVAVMMLAEQVVAGDGPMELTFALPAGTKLHYRLETEIEATVRGAVFTTTLSADAVLTPVVDAKSENVLVNIVFEKVEGATRMGDEIRPLDVNVDGRSAQAEVTRRGVLVHVEPAADLSTAQKGLLTDLADAFFAQLPAKPVKVGEEWKQDLVTRKASESGSGDFTFEEITEKYGVECARILGEFAMQSSEPALKGKGRVESHIAVAGGYVVAQKGTLDMQGEGPGALQSFELKLKR